MVATPPVPVQVIHVPSWPQRRPTAPPVGRNRISSVRRSGPATTRSGAATTRSGAATTRSGAATTRSGAATTRSGAATTRSGAATMRSGAATIKHLWNGLLIIAGCALAGCAPYRFGDAALFPTGIQTVHVPIAHDTTVRHNLGLQLTEAIIREIELRTPYKVTPDPSADTTLTCVVTNEAKTVLSETNEDYPRALDGSVQVRASWTDRQGRLLFNNSVIPTEDLAILFTQTERFVPEAGQSVDTAMQQAIEDLAARIVSQMENRW